MKLNVPYVKMWCLVKHRGILFSYIKLYITRHNFYQGELSAVTGFNNLIFCTNQRDTDTRLCKIWLWSGWCKSPGCQATWIVYSGT